VTILAVPQDTRVSIHASAREATARKPLPEPHHRVSIHASAREATPLGGGCIQHRSVSIHASAREATGWTLRTGRPLQCFNPRLREGGDCRSRDTYTHSMCFNPRLREGGDWQG